MIINFNEYIKEELTYKDIITKVSNFYKSYNINNKFLKTNYIYSDNHLFTHELYFNNSENQFKSISYITIDTDHNQIRVGDNIFNKQINYNNIHKYKITYDIDIILEKVRKKLNNFYIDYTLNLEEYISTYDNGISDIEYKFIDIPVITYESFVNYVSNIIKNNIKLIDNFKEQIYNNKEYDVMSELFRKKIGYLIDANNFDLI
jgi:hypothetical protein